MSPSVRFLVDEDFDNDILRGVLRKLPALDIVRVQDVGLGGQKDPVVLAWAADEDRLLLTHDVSTRLPKSKRFRFGWPRFRTWPPIGATSMRLVVQT
jgi:hypothetical protein